MMKTKLAVVEEVQEEVELEEVAEVQQTTVGVAVASSVAVEAAASPPRIMAM